MNTKDPNTIAYIISEATTVSKHTILNSEKSDSVIVEVELQDASEFNRNKRNYGYDVLDSGLKGEKVRELIARKSWVGEAGHPVNPTLQRQMSFDHDRLSHRILKWWWDGTKVMGLVETLNSRYGNEMKNYIRQEMETAYSLRAVGPVTKTAKGDVVQKPLSVLTYDWVFIPSHKGSYQREILKESCEFDGVNKLSEGYCLPISESSALSYIASESENYKIISDCYDFSKGTVELSESGVIYTTSDGKTTNKMHLKIEDYITRDINASFDKYRRY